MIDLPSHVGLERLGEDLRRSRTIHRCMVLIALFRDVSQQALQVPDLDYGPAAEGVQWIRGNLTLAHVNVIKIRELAQT